MDIIEGILDFIAYSKSAAKFDDFLNRYFNGTFFLIEIFISKDIDSKIYEDDSQLEIISSITMQIYNYKDDFKVMIRIFINVFEILKNKKLNKILITCFWT